MAAVECCDLLEKSYFCSIANNHEGSLSLYVWLWFAWKIVLLQYRKQPPAAAIPAMPSCDLLEKSYFCSIANNLTLYINILNIVVICLKNRTFAVSQTTWGNPKTSLSVLWFAWKIVLLQYRKQLIQLLMLLLVRCDLLEKSYFCSIANNSIKAVSSWIQLWFAWKIVLLQYRKQLRYISIIIRDSCDLLEKSYFCSIANNSVTLPLTISWVVICLKNRTFAVSQTTKYGSVVTEFGCDLLEKSYFCSIANNLLRRGLSRAYVVICLKNRTFAVSQTTTHL